MGKPTGFMEYNRVNNVAAAPTKRIKDFDEFHVPLSDEERRIQGARCMDCGVPVYYTHLLKKDYDCVVLCCGASNPRDIKAPGREACGIYFAVDYLKRVTKNLLDTSYKDYYNACLLYTS